MNQRWPSIGNKKNILKCIMFDSFVHMPFIYLPLFYMIREIPNNPQALSFRTWFNDGFQKYRPNILEDSLIGLKLFIPAHCITFGVLPSNFFI